MFLVGIIFFLVLFLYKGNRIVMIVNCSVVISFYIDFIFRVIFFNYFLEMVLNFFVDNYIFIDRDFFV